MSFSTRVFGISYVSLVIKAKRDELSCQSVETRYPFKRLKVFL